MINPYDNHPVQKRKLQRMTEEFSALNIEIEVKANDGFAVYVKNGAIECNLHSDFVLYFDKERITPMLLEKIGVRVFNSARATEICDDKMLTHTVLANEGIPMPDTVAGPLCYNPNAAIGDAYLDKVVEKLGLPVVVKQCHGSFGEQVYLCDTRRQLEKILEEIKSQSYLLQHYEKESRGRDMRVIVIGGKVVCAMVRSNDADFRSNASLGSKCEKTIVPSQIAAMCEKVARIIGLDYCGIDVLLTDPPKLCEVNSNAMFEKIEQVTGFNVARAYVEHIKSCIEKHL